MKQLTINIDMDGVIYDMLTPLANLAHSKAAQDLFDFDDAAISTDVAKWDIADSWGMKSKTQFWKFFYWAVDEGLFFYGPPIEGSIETIGSFVKAGHRVRIVTSKQFNDSAVTRKAQSDVIDWLAVYAPEWAHKVEVAFAGNKQGYEADLIIDDKPTLAWAQEGKVNVLFDHTWNQEVDAAPVGMYPTAPLLYRAESWVQVKYLADRMAASSDILTTLRY